MTNHDKYQAYLTRVAPTDERRGAGTCWSASKAMTEEFPELRQAAGYYHCPISNRAHPHWWCVAPDGEVLDPTRQQFRSHEMFGNVPLSRHEAYVAYEEIPEIKRPLSRCMDCGEDVFAGDPRPFCSEECCEAYKKYCGG